MRTVEDFLKIEELFNSYDEQKYKVTINWDYIWTIPEFIMLKTTEQSPKWHSEGKYVSDHVIKVVEAAVDFVENQNNTLTLVENEILLLSAIFHDVGKWKTTFFKESDQLWHHYGHEIESERITRRILWDLPIDLREGVCSLVRWHMEPMTIIKSKDFFKKIFDLSYKVPSLKLLTLLKKFDMSGSVSENPSLTANDDKLLENFKNIAKDLNCYDGHNPAMNTFKFFSHETSKKPKLFADVYIGLPGAGKDTAIHNDPDFTNKFVACRDDIRIELGMCSEGEKTLGTTEEENTVTKIFNDRVKKAAKDGKYIVFNNMNIRRKYRDEYKKLLSDYDVWWRYIICEARGLEKNIERRDGQVPARCFPSFIEKMDWPDPDEYDRIEFVLS